jgi:hypothetical protein
MFSTETVFTIGFANKVLNALFVVRIAELWNKIYLLENGGNLSLFKVNPNDIKIQRLLLLDYMILINCSVLKDLQENSSIKIVKRHQKDKNNASNIFVTPIMGIKVYKPFILYVTSTYVVLQFNKSECLSLFTMLRSINHTLKTLVDPYIGDGRLNFYDMYQEKEDFTFTLRCTLPTVNVGGKLVYNVKSFDEQTRKEVPFTLPRSKVGIEYATISIKNLWQTGEKAGFNLSLNEISN